MIDDYTILTTIRDNPDQHNGKIARMCGVRRKRVGILRRSITAPVAASVQTGTYFVADEHGRVKIGHTDVGARHRIAELQTGNADELILLGITEQNECELHVKFAHYHVRGEWFVLSEEIKEFIKNEV